MGMVLRLVFAFRVLFYGMLFFFSGDREQFVENTGREFFSQYRPIGDDAVVVVDECNAVDSTDRIDAEYRVDVLRFE